MTSYIAADRSAVSDIESYEVLLAVQFASNTKNSFSDVP